MALMLIIFFADNFDNVADDNGRHKKDLDSIGGGNALSDVALLRGLGAAEN